MKKYFLSIHYIHAADEALKRSMEQRESPPKELPSKMYKFKRMKERQYLSQTLNFDSDHAEKVNSNKNQDNEKLNNNKKCAGTQTPFSSFTNNQLASRGPTTSTVTSVSNEAVASTSQTDNYRILDLDKSGSPPSSSPRAVPSRPPPMYMPVHHDPRMNPHINVPDMHTVPLNLAPPRTPHSMMHSPHASHPRPSVITTTPPGGSGTPPYIPPGMSGSHTAMFNDQRAPMYPRMQVRTGASSDSDIEEHFRRSLGNKYPGYMSKKSPGPTKTPSPPAMVVDSPSSSPGGDTRHSPNSLVSVTGTVDDHFAKALGYDKWVQLKEGPWIQLNEGDKDPLHRDLSTGSVDDHFAKALGDTWYKIKAEKERSSTNVQQSGPHIPAP